MVIAVLLDNVDLGLGQGCDSCAWSFSTYVLPARYVAVTTAMVVVSARHGAPPTPFWFLDTLNRSPPNNRFRSVCLCLLALLVCVFLLVRNRFILSDPKLKELFSADYCVTELGGASIPDFKLKPTLSFFQSTAEKGEGCNYHRRLMWRPSFWVSWEARQVGRIHASLSQWLDKWLAKCCLCVSFA